MMEEWLVENMHAVLIAIEIVWVGGFLAIFVLWYFLRRHVARRRARTGIPPQTPLPREAPADERSAPPR